MTNLRALLLETTCEVCGGSGVIGRTAIVTHDMATDAGEPEMEGMPIPDQEECPHCVPPLATRLPECAAPGLERKLNAGVQTEADVERFIGRAVKVLASNQGGVEIIQYHDDFKVDAIGVHRAISLPDALAAALHGLADEKENANA